MSSANRAVLATLTALSFLFSIAHAAAPLKIASIAPKGSIYHRVLQEIGQAYRKAEGGRARAIVYPDSLQGTEADTVRRMRVGQLDASMLSVVGLSQIDESIAALQFMPMMFRSWSEVDHVREVLRPELEAKLAARGFVVLMWGEAGWVQFFTRQPIALPQDFKRTKVWAWDGDTRQIDIMKTMGFRPVPLPIADILPGLETGLVDTIPVAPMWSLIGQFDRITHFMLPINWVPIVGATVISKRRFDRLAPRVRDAMLTAANAGADKLRAHRAKQDREAVAAMERRGLTVQTLTPAIEAAWQDLARDSWPHVRGSMVPAAMFDKVQASLAAYREQ